MTDLSNLYRTDYERDRLARLLAQAPGLKPRPPTVIATTYADAVTLAAKETGLTPATFPVECPYSPAQIQDDGLFPGRAVLGPPSGAR